MNASRPSVQGSLPCSFPPRPVSGIMDDLLGGKTPKAILHELYQTQVSTPSFSVVQDSVLPGSTFTCTLDLPGISGAFEGASFQGTARSKKLAEQAAAEKALHYAREHAERLLIGRTSFGSVLRRTGTLSASAPTETQVHFLLSC